VAASTGSGSAGAAGSSQSETDGDTTRPSSEQRGLALLLARLQAADCRIASASAGSSAGASGVGNEKKIQPSVASEPSVSLRLLRIVAQRLTIRVKGNQATAAGEVPGKRGPVCARKATAAQLSIQQVAMLRPGEGWAGKQGN